MSNTNIYELHLNVDMYVNHLLVKYISTIYNTEFTFIKKSNKPSRTIHLSSKQGIYKLKQVD